MKHIKKHPINDKAQKLSKDMKKQDLVKPKKDKELDADDSLANPKISKKYTKPSNRKLDGENFLSKDAGKIKKTNEKIDHQLDPRILAHNIKHNINDFSEEEIMDLFITYAEQQKNV